MIYELIRQPFIMTGLAGEVDGEYTDVTFGTFLDCKIQLNQRYWSSIGINHELLKYDIQPSE